MKVAILTTVLLLLSSSYIDSNITKVSKKVKQVECESCDYENKKDSIKMVIKRINDSLDSILYTKGKTYKTDLKATESIVYAKDKIIKRDKVLIADKDMKITKLNKRVNTLEYELTDMRRLKDTVIRRNDTAQVTPKKKGFFKKLFKK